MSAEAAVRAWVNDPARGLVGEGNPLVLGAYLVDQRSPAAGAYTVVSRNAEGVSGVVAEDDGAVTVARMQFMVYAGTIEAAGNAAAALRREIDTLTGLRQRCGDSGVTVLVADNRNGPFYVPGTAEPYCFQVGADFLLTPEEE